MTDEFGEYCHTTVDPQSAALVYDAAKVNVPSLGKYGYTEEDARAAQKIAITWLAEQVLDSTRLDNYAQPATEWFAENRGPLSDSLGAAIESKGLLDSGTLVTDILPSPMNRTGEPRAKSTEITVEAIGGGPSGDGIPTLAVMTSAVVVWDATDKAIVDATIDYHSEKTEEGLKVSIPELFDGDDSTELVLKGTFDFGFVRAADGWELTGQHSNFKLETGTGITVIE